MKSRFLIGLSASALVIFILVQYIIITETYRTRQAQFDSRFGNLVRSGMQAFTGQPYNYRFDSLLFVLDNLAVDYLYGDPDTMGTHPAREFYRLLSGYREPEVFLKEFLRNAGEVPEFTFHLRITDLHLLDMGYSHKVYPDSVSLPDTPPSALLAGSYTHERNFFRLSYEILINFTNRSAMILREMWFILALDLLTLILVFTVFYLTLRNMLRQARLSDIKSDFINNMTHELKTPLSTISVASSALSDGKIVEKPRRVEELSGLIKRQNRHLSELIDRILDIHIWEKDQVRLQYKEVLVKEWIRGLLKAFSMEGEHSPEIRLDLQLRSSTFRMDEVHMSTVIHNLLSNAVKYGNPPHRIILEVTLDETGLQISVSDNGPGIGKEEMKHLFEKFYRGRESRKKVIRGLGLGLYYVKQIVEAHGGGIRVESSPGKGSRFIIQIPKDHGFTAS